MINKKIKIRINLPKQKEKIFKEKTKYNRKGKNKIDIKNIIKEYNYKG